MGNPGGARSHAVPDTICPLPWLNLSLDVDGSSRPCCKFAHASPTSAYQLANLKDASLDEVWNGPAMQQLRSDFRSGSQPAECSACWDEEAVGIRSFRQTYLDDRGITSPPAYDDLTPDQPVALDLKLSNACNLKCRVCGPVASSSWLVEELQADAISPGVRKNLSSNRSYYLSNKVTDVATNRASLERWAPYIEHVELTGGEPMFSKENREVIDIIVEHGRPEHTTFLLTTNATIVDDRVLGHLPRFKDVMVALSIDDIGPRLEYERSGAIWSEVESNIARYAELASPSCLIVTNCTVSVFNVWYLPEYYDWILTTYPDQRVRPELNLVHDPKYFSVKALSPELKESVGTRLTRELVARRGLPEHARRQVEELIRFMSTSEQPGGSSWQLALSEIEQRDRIRSEQFAKVFPEFWEQIRSCGQLPTAHPTPAGTATRLRRGLRRIRPQQ